MGCRLEHLVVRDVEAAAQEGVNLGGQHQRLAGPRTGAVADVAASQLRRFRQVGMGRQHQASRIVSQIACNRYLAGELLELQDAGPVGDRLHRVLEGAGRAAKDLMQLLPRGVAHVELEEEAIELGLRQRVGPLHLDRVLGGQDEEWPRELVRFVGDGDGLLLHRLEQGRLGLGGGAVDLVGQDQVGEDRARLEAEMARAAGVLADDVGAHHVGRHQVRRELDAAVAQVDSLGQRPDQDRLAQAGQAFEQNVPAR